MTEGPKLPHELPPESLPVRIGQRNAAPHVVVVDIDAGQHTRLEPPHLLAAQASESLGW